MPIAEAQQDQDTDDAYIADVFGPGGLLAQRFQGYEARVGQLELAYGTDRAFREGHNLLAEAPTGTGKSLAYSVPATYHAARHGRRVAIVTANIALQEQLVTKDLPLLSELLPWKFTFALAKGINNYLCREQFDDAVNEQVLAGGYAPGSPEHEQWSEVMRWAGTTKTGDLSELSFEPLVQLRPRFTTTSEDCLGKKCPNYQGCLAIQARRAARSAQVVVTNYHLFFADLQIKRGGGEGVLPPYDLVIFDEGHKAADIARDFFGFRLTGFQVRWATRLLKASKKGTIPPLDPELQQRIHQLSDRFFDQLAAFARSDHYRARLRAPLTVAWEPLAEALVESAEVLFRGVAEYGHLDSALLQELHNASDRCRLLASNLRAAGELADPSRMIYFIELSQAGRASLCSLPIEVGPLLRETLFEHEKVRSVVVTSATLVSAGSFDFVAGELGAENAEELIAESPFDWESQCLLVMPGGIADPTDRKFAAEAAEAVVEAVREARGRTLCLFTSYRVLDLAHQRLVREGLPYRVLRQGQAPRTTLIRQFKEDVDSVLLGTESFWAGVDIPGEALSCVVVDRLPFDSPDDPLVDAVTSRDRNAFKRFMVPRAILQFRQGIGRLIRTRTDRGVAVVLDRRVVDKGYGRLFTRSLPTIRQSRRMTDIGDFLR